MSSTIWIDAEPLPNGVYVVRNPVTDHAIASIRKIGNEFVFVTDGGRVWEADELRYVADVVERLNREGSLVSLGGSRA